LISKFGMPKGQGKFNKSFYNIKTKRSFNLHWDPRHKNGLPHIDIRKRGYYYDKYYYLKGGE